MELALGIEKMDRIGRYLCIDYENHLSPWLINKWINKISGDQTTFTSRMSNLAVLTFDQVFFSLETGLIFIPAFSSKGHKEDAETRAKEHIIILD